MKIAVDRAGTLLRRTHRTAGRLAPFAPRVLREIGSSITACMPVPASRGMTCSAKRPFSVLQQRSGAALSALVEYLEFHQQARFEDILPSVHKTPEPHLRGVASVPLRGHSSSGRQSVFFVGPLSPPVTGRTVTTVEIARQLAMKGVRLRLLNTAPLWTVSSPMRKVSRAARSLKACLALVVCRSVDCVYVSVDADSGMYLTILLALSSRAGGARLVLHHHNYSYIARKTLRMSLLALAAGPNAVHVNVCRAMADEMKNRYPTVQKTMVLSNAISVRAIAPGAKAAAGPLVLGHLSNLSFDKGLGTVTNCLRLLRREGIDARLAVAGPVGSERVAQFLREAAREFDGAFGYLGPLYDHEKQAFYQRIDVFLFPSRYRNETQGIVNLEAMAAGVPVIAYGQCCIPSDLEDRGGLVVPCGEEFERMAVPQLACWARDRHLLHRASATARQRFEQLRLQGEREFHALWTLLAADLGHRVLRQRCLNDQLDANDDRTGGRSAEARHPAPRKVGGGCS